MRSGPLGAALRLLPETEFRDQRIVAIDVLALQLIEQRAPLVDHHQQAPARMVVLVVILEVTLQRVDAAGQDRDLDFRRTGVTRLAGVVTDDFLLLFGGYRHVIHSATSERLNPLTTRASPPESSTSATGTGPNFAQ